VSEAAYGLMAEFETPTGLVNAARAARDRGYRRLDAYSPFPIEELSDALHLHKNRLSLIVLVGMWLERFVIIVSSLAQDYLNSSWHLFHATRWDWGTYLGTIGLFLFLFFLFIRLLPMISIFEMRTLLPEAKVNEEVGQ
jgi:hypothetical protein